MIHNLTSRPGIASKFLAELRDVNMQQDRMRFRKNLERLGSIFAYEISKTLDQKEMEVETPLGQASCQIHSDSLVLCPILRAALPLHYGMLDFFDDADSAFISAYRKHHRDGTFEISVDYITCPDLTDKTLILIDPMLATGSSIQASIQGLREYGVPRKTHVVSVIASSFGVNYIRRYYPNAELWLAAIDDELTAKSYIVPGLGDAGDLAFGKKLQE
jgi:uracil phosphoribosyltransferase